jgi:DNA-binding transcriptional ArsR family regulator
MKKSPFKKCTVVCFNKEKIASLKKQLPADKELLESARRHKAIGHPARQAILHTLSIDECCVCDVAEVLGKPVSTVSQHLRTLVSEGLLDYRQEGKLIFYSLTPYAKAVVKFLDTSKGEAP